MGKPQFIRGSGLRLGLVPKIVTNWDHIGVIQAWVYDLKVATDLVNMDNRITPIFENRHVTVTFSIAQRPEKLWLVGMGGTKEPVVFKGGT